MYTTALPPLLVMYAKSGLVPASGISCWACVGNRSPKVSSSFKNRLKFRLS